jgi:hypothetical protein
MATDAQTEGTVRALTRTLGELRERTEDRDRAVEAARGMRGTEALLRGQVAALTAERDSARALVREAAPWMGGALEMANPGDVARLTGWLDRAKALLADWHDSLDAAVPGAGTMLRNQDGE